MPFRKYLFFPGLLFIWLAISSCGRYGWVDLNYPQAPAVILPDGINKIAIVNRSQTSIEDKKQVLSEQVRTGEIGGSDRLASDDCLKGAFDRLNGTPRYSIVFPSITRLPGTGTRVTPEVLPWETVIKICQETGSDALLVLETFDSNSDLLVATVANNITNVLSGGVKPVLPRQIQMNVYCHWRLYSPVTKTIIDQYQSKSHIVFDAIGPEYTLPPPDALHQTAYAAGQEYVSRFLPSYYIVRRDLYKRGKGASNWPIRQGFRRAEVANWEGAIDTWTQVVNNGSPRNAGRACLNIAVAYEVLGNTGLALQWAKRGYEDYRNKLSRDYAKILLNRQNIENTP